jgi:ferredoxin
MGISDTTQWEFQPISKQVRTSCGTTIPKSTRQAGVDPASACGGEGNYRQCQIIISEGQIHPTIQEEEFILSETEICVLGPPFRGREETGKMGNIVYCLIMTHPKISDASV